MTVINSQDVRFEDLNNSEIRTLAEEKLGRLLSPWTPRADLIKFLLGGDAPKNPIDDIRSHQIGSILDNYKSYHMQLSCEVNCYEHNDLRVMECQFLNPQLRHPCYPKDHNNR